MDFRISAIYPLIAALLSFLLSIFVITKGYRKVLNVSFVFVCLSVFIYSFGAFMEFTSLKIHVADFWARFLHIGVSFLPFAFVNFIYTFLDLKKKSTFYWIAFFFSSFFALLLFTTPWLIKGVQPKESVNFYSAPGPLYAPFAFLFVLLLIKGYHILWKGYKRSKGLRKMQIRYIYLSTFLGFLVGLTLGFGVIFEKIHNVPQSIHHIGALIYILGVAYSIFKHQLLDIRVIITRLGISLAAYSIVFILPFYVGYKTGYWPLSTALATVLAIPATLIYRYFRIKTEQIFLKKQQRYRDILRSSSERLLWDKDKEALLRDMATLIFDNVSPSFVAVYLPDTEGYSLSIALPQPVSLPLKIDRSHPLCIQQESDAEVYNFGDQSVALTFCIGEKNLYKGIVLLGEKKDGEIYYDEDREVFRTFMNQVFIGLENIVHIQAYITERQEKERLKQEVALARQIQQNLLPNTVPTTKGFTVRGKLLPANEVAGDYYDFISYSPERVGIVIADVSGKGVDAGMVMSITKSALITLARKNISPRQLVIELNDVLFSQLKRQRFISLNYGEYDARSHTFSWAGAGQENILIYHPLQERQTLPGVEIIKTGGIILGVLEDVSAYIVEQTMTLREQDKIVLYTDGVVESKNAQDETLSLEGFVQIIAGFQPEGKEDFMQYLHESIQQYIGNTPLGDDITFVTIERE